MDILNGNLEPGERLREEDIANKLELSRTPIREAIRRLAVEELVILSPNRGATVRVYEIDDIEKVYNLRAQIEGYAASLAAINYSDRIIQEMEKSNRDYKNALYAFFSKSKKDDIIVMELIDANRRFHNLIIEASENQYIHDVISKLATLPLTFQAFNRFDKQQFLNTIEIHENIYTAIKNRDANHAKALMTSHILHGRDYVISHTKGSNNKQ